MAWFTIRSDQRFNFPPHKKMSRTRRVALLKSYVPDWIICIVLAAVFFSLDKVPGFKRQFSIEDPTLRFPYAVHERVPTVALYFIAIVAPFVIQIVVNLLSVRSLWDFHNSTLGLLLGLTLTGAITQFTKITVGRPRPDIISRCQPPSGITNPEYGLVSAGICTQTDENILRDGWRSFFSGHSSLSFAGLGFLSFYLAGKLHLFDEKGHTTKAWISLTPLSGAALVAISRTMDYRHHWQDVLVGSLLGLVMSFFAYRQYYPPLSSPRAHKPFSPRIGRERDERGGDESSPSDESHAPILPFVRPESGIRSLGRGSGSGSLGRHSSSPRGGVGRNGNEPGGGPGNGGVGVGVGRERGSGEGRESTDVLTHPVQPHIHVHSAHTHAHPYGGTEYTYPQNGTYRDGEGESAEDLQREARREQEDVKRSHEVEVELDSPLKGFK